MDKRGVDWRKLHAATIKPRREPGRADSTVRQLRVLFVEDSEDDFNLLVRALAKGGLEVAPRRLDTARAMQEALDEGGWDLVLADHGMPEFNALAALDTLMRSGLDVPFIIVSGVIGEDVAVEAMKAGAQDYIMKGNLSRLVPAIKRALHEATVRQERRLADEALRVAELEKRVEQRTAELALANEDLRIEVAQRKQVEEVLRESEERFRLLVEGVQDYAIFMLDPEGRIVSWNAGAQRITGWTAAEVIERHFSVFYPQNATDEGNPQKELTMAAAQGHYEDEGLRVRKDGSQFWANVVITPLRDDHGRLRGFAKVTRDITQRKHAEHELERLLSEISSRSEFFQSVVENASVGIAVLGGSDLRCRVINPAFQAISPGKQMLGRPWLEVWAEVAAEIRPLIDGVLASGEPYRAVDALYRISRAPNWSRRKRTSRLPTCAFRGRSMAPTCC